MNGCDNFEVRTVLDKNTLRCEIIHEKNYDILSYSFMLIRDGIKVDHVYTALNHYEFFLEDSGVYVVQGYIKTTSRNDYLRSFPVQYFCDAFVQKFDEFLQCKENFSCNNNRKIPLYVKKYPYADFCCIIFKNKKKLSYFLEYLKHSSFSEYYFECNVKNKSIIFQVWNFVKIYSVNLLFLAVSATLRIVSFLACRIFLTSKTSLNSGDVQGVLVVVSLPKTGLSYLQIFSICAAYSLLRITTLFLFAMDIICCL